VRGVSGRSVQANVAAIADSLPASQRRVAELVVRDPEAVAFGTVGSVAAKSGTSNPTVIRFAARLGFDGFTALRDAVRDEVSRQIQSAIGRVNQPSSGPLLERALAVETANVERTLAALDDATLSRATDLLADLDRRVWVLPNSQMQGVAAHLADDLQLCRPRVVLLSGSEFRIATALARLRPGDVVLSLDTQRHERWLVRVQRSAVQRGAVPLAVTDRLPCSLDITGGLALTFACDTTNPFESQVGLLALANLLVSAVVERLRPKVADRVERLEQTWVDNDLFDV
jgi:DNA-binding MurR/RpiR family transcriptional regulator